MRALPQGPKGLPWLGKALSYARDPVGFLGALTRGYADACHLKSCGFDFFVLLDPALVEDAFYGNARHYHKAPFLNAMEEVLGKGLLVAEGEHWRRQRKLVQHAFMPDKVASYVTTMDARCRALLPSWTAPGAIDADQEMMRLALDVMASCIFGSDVSAKANEVKRAVDDISRFFELAIGPLGFVFRKVPSPPRRRCLQGAATLDAIMYGLIAEARASDTHDFGLLSKMLRAYAAAGTEIPVQQVRDDLITILLAGHETTALALTYTLRLLALHPEAQETAAREVASLSAESPLTTEDLARLPYLRKVVLESLRLYPPAWVFGRQAVEAHDVGPYHLPKGTVIVACPWWLQRSAAHFPEPEAFRPERWQDGFQKSLPKAIFAPFGMGPRMCVGQEFAMTEMLVILTRLLQRFSFAGADPRPMDLQPSITIRPRHAVRLTIAPRKSSQG